MFGVTFAFERTARLFLMLFSAHQRRSVFLSDAWPAPATYHRSPCERDPKGKSETLITRASRSDISLCVFGSFQHSKTNSRSARSKRLRFCTYRQMCIHQHTPTTQAAAAAGVSINPEKKGETICSCTFVVVFVFVRTAVLQRGPDVG